MTGSSQPDSDFAGWVVRGGVTTPAQLQNGTREHLQAPGIIGFSVQYQPGRTIEELALAGQYPHAQVSATTLSRLMAAGDAAGYNVTVVESPGRGFHHPVVVPVPLPDRLAEELSGVFDQFPNPIRRRE